jgi:hypothetical protein
MNNQLKKSIDIILDERENKLSGEVLSKLNQSRQVALSQSPKIKFNPLLWIIPLAASVVLSVYILNPLNNNMPLNTNMDDGTVSNDYTLAEDMDVSEDLDFYLWLAQEESVNI